MRNLSSFPLKLIWVVVLSLFSSALLAQSYSHYKDHHQQQHHKPAEPVGIHKKTVAKSVVKTSEKSEATDDLQDQDTIPEKTEDEIMGEYLLTARHVSKDSLSKIKAVIISASVDGPNGKSTQEFMEAMKYTAHYLKVNGVKVHEFYSPDDSWARIVEQAAGAHILIYAGHGVFDGSRPPKWVGGFSLTKEFVTSQNILEQLKLAPHALVMFNHACFTAGSAGGDVGDIGLKEAHRRVAIYSHPFVDLGVACYYADNFDGSTVDFLDEFLSKRKVKDIYKQNASKWSEILENKPYDFNKLYSIGVSKYNETSYCVAYVGKPDFSVIDWFRKN